MAEASRDSSYRGVGVLASIKQRAPLYVKASEEKIAFDGTCCQRCLIRDTHRQMRSQWSAAGPFTAPF